jgi:hypothetical protein
MERTKKLGMKWDSKIVSVEECDCGEPWNCHFGAACEEDGKRIAEARTRYLELESLLIDEYGEEVNGVAELGMPSYVVAAMRNLDSVLGKEWKAHP